MTAHRMRARLTRAFSVITASALVATITLTSTAFADSPGKKLSKDDRERLAAATASGATTVTMLFATVETSTGAVASALAALGATVRKQDADVGYIRADVPTDRADAAAKIAGVVASEIDQVFDVPSPAPDATGDELQVDPPGAGTPAQNPYMPTRDTGAPQFVAAHPTWDGRGVTIGILDTGLDIAHPALQTTTTGERKVVDWISYTDPVTDSDPSWIKMDTTVTVVGGTFTVGSGATAKTYTGAPDGLWRYGEFTENTNLFQRTNGTATAEYRISSCSNHPATGGGDLNRNGACDEIFAFLWDGFQNGYVWRDSDADGSFADEVGMREYKKDFAIGEYGHDNPATAVRESVPFVTQIDAATGYVSLGVVSGAHATHVSGIMAGSTLFGTATGAAPGAKIVSIRVCLFTSGCTAHALTEGMIFATKNAHVDVVNMSIGGLPSLNDGNNARATLYNRLIDKWGAQLFISAGNSGPGVNTVGDPSVATKVMSVGAYWTSASVLSNYGNVVPGPEALHDFSSRGPREDGGFKPDVIAPGNAVSGVPTWQPGQPVAGTYALPPGLGMFNGTSMAAPQATGAAALLLSAAIAAGHGHKPAQLRQAMRSTARFIAGYQAHEQGFGLINVSAAWSQLEQDVKTTDLSSAVATNTKLSGFLATPGFGTGIYDREGIHPGSGFYIRNYTFTKNDGGGATYNLSWIGNDGTFALPTGVSTLSFANGGSASLAITVTPGAAGAHSAILVLDDPKTVGVDYATMNTVIVSMPLDAAHHYEATIASSASKFQASQPKMFFDVPESAAAMSITLTITNNGRVNATAQHPFGVPVTAGTQSISLTTGPGMISSIVTTGPVAGVWEVASAASRAAVPNNSTFTITFKAYSVSFDPPSWTRESATAGTSYAQSFTLTDVLAGGSISNRATAFASTITVPATIAAGGPQQSYAIDVPTGSTLLTVSIGSASDPGADLDLFVYRCPTPASCVLVGQSAGSSSNETVTVRPVAPATTIPAGAYKAIVDPFAVPKGTTNYTYTDSIANLAYGGVSATTAATARATSDSWSVTATATPLVAPGTGRVLRATFLAEINLAAATTVPQPPGASPGNGPQIGAIGSASIEFANITGP